MKSEETEAENEIPEQNKTIKLMRRIYRETQLPITKKKEVFLQNMNTTKEKKNSHEYRKC